MCCPQCREEKILFYCMSSCIYMYSIVFKFVFLAVLMGIGLHLTNMCLFWLLLYSFVCKILNYVIHIKIYMYFCCVFFHTMLTVA